MSLKKFLFFSFMLILGMWALLMPTSAIFFELFANFGEMQ